MEVNEALRRFRTSYGLSYAEVANILGVKTQTWQMCEYGITKPTVKTILKLAKHFNISADYLLGLSDNPNYVPIDPELVQAIRAVHADVQKVWAKVK